jgi:alpha-L-arabinofuranosidase
MRNFIKLFILLLVFPLLNDTINAQTGKATSDPKSLLPDGTSYMSWDDQTHYKKIYHVSANNPKASDQNDGSEDHPFLTINHAAQVVNAGECVYIHSGIYRELVRPFHSGNSPDSMITYQAAPGEEAVLRGSRVISTKWILSVDPHDSLAAAGSLKLNEELGFPANSYSKQIMMTSVSENLFENRYFPLKTANTTDAEFDLMNWATRWKGRIPYTLPRCLLFEDGQRMAQLAAYEDLVRIPGSYWVAPDGKTIHIHAFGKDDPNNHMFELATQHHIIQPQTIGLGYIHIKGLTLEHCANGFLRSGEGALFTMGGHHWIIEDNTVRQINALGIEVGSSAFESRDPRNPINVSAQAQRPLQGQTRSTTQPVNPNLGHNIIRGNIVSDCGTAGIRGLSVVYALVENNYISNCGWQDAEFHWEVAGIKLLGARGTIVRNNYISHMLGGCGIWLDFNNQNSRITGNVLVDIKTVQGAIFIEASQVTNMVDNNILWNVNGEGVRLADTDNALVVHNLLANVSEEQVVARVATDRSLGGRKLTSKGNHILNNIIVNPGKPVLAEDPTNIADYNFYLSTIAGRTVMKDPGLNSKVIQGEISLDEEKLDLFWKPVTTITSVPVIKNCESDFFNIERTKTHNFPGPFQGLTGPVILKLYESIVIPSGKVQE